MRARPALILAASLGLLAGAAALPVQAVPAAAITVDYGAPGPTINPLLYGTNSRFTNDWENVWSPAEGQAKSGFTATYRDLFVNGASGPTSLRYPGGTVANTFRWKWSIGSDRRTQETYDFNGNPWKGDTFPRFGLDEAARFAEANNSKLVWVYNFANGSASDAADLVEYLNATVGTNPNGGTAWADVRRDNGHAAPYGVRYFEIGNEVSAGESDFWLHAERYNATEVARRYIDGADGYDGFADYYQAMRSTANQTPTSVEVFSALPSNAFIDLMGSNRPYDGIVKHLYASDLPADDAGYHDQAMVRAKERAAELLAARDRMRSRVGGSRAAGMDAVVTEYGVLDGNQNQRQTMTQAIYVSKMLLDFMSQDTAFAQKHITTEIDVTGEDDGQWVIAPESTGWIPSATARALKLFTHHFGNQLVGHTLDTPTRTAAGGGQQLNQLQVRASKDGQGNCYIAVVNSNRGDGSGGGAVTASIDVNGYDPAGTADVYTLNSDNFTSFNTKAGPNNVVISTSTKTGVGSGSFTHTFPPHSVTVIELHR